MQEAWRRGHVLAAARPSRGALAGCVLALLVTAGVPIGGADAVPPPARVTPGAAIANPGCGGIATAHALLDAVSAGCKVIAVVDEARIDLSQVQGDNPPSSATAVLALPDGVTLESGRSPTVAGGLLFMSHDVGKNMLELGDRDRVTGLRSRGTT